MLFMACLMNLVCFFCELAERDEVRWRRKLCYGKNLTGRRFIMVCLNSMEKNTEKQ
jgi:hypothetical protein